MTFDWGKRSWAVIDALFKDDDRLVEHHIKSYNYFVEKLIPLIVEGCNPVKFDADFNVELGEYLTEYRVFFKNPQLSEPIIEDSDGTKRMMYPNDARLDNLSYEGTLFMDIEQQIVRRDPKSGNQSIEQLDTIKNVEFGKIPIMLRSKYCVLSKLTREGRCEMGEGAYDKGGYFVIGGNEKVVMPQERKRENKAYLFEHPSDKFSHVCEINSIEYNASSYPKRLDIKLKASSSNFGRTINVKINSVNHDVPLFIMFRALGVLSDKEITNYIVYNFDTPLATKMLEVLRPSILEATQFQTQEDALDYISKFLKITLSSKKSKLENARINLTRDIMEKNLLPHVGTDPINKAYYLGYMTQKLIKFSLGMYKADDRDSFFNKRISTTGDLLATLFRTNLTENIRALSKTIRKEQNLDFVDISKTIKDRIKKDLNKIAKGIKTGNWGVSQKQEPNRTGVSQNLDRLSFASALSSCRRVISPIDKSGKQPEPRKLHPTQYYMFCAFETPEGGSVGIVKNMALSSTITVPALIDPVMEILMDLGTVPLKFVVPEEVYYAVKVFLNGNWVGIHNDPKTLEKELRDRRRSGIINIYTSIAFNTVEGEIHINNDGGRITRPIYIVENNKLLMTEAIAKKLESGEMVWEDLLCEKGPDNPCVVEYVDVDESDTMMYATDMTNLIMNRKTNSSFLTYTHLEINPCLMLGVVVGTVPYPDHSQAPRNLYAGAMIKQGMGVYNTNFQGRFDTKGHVLHYPQRQLVAPKLTKYVNSNDTPNGIPVIVAVLSWTGYNQEDSLIMNKSFIERGGFVSDTYTTYKDDVKSSTSTKTEEIFMRPREYAPDGSKHTAGMKVGSYDKLDENGFARIGEIVYKGDVIIGKVIPLVSDKPDDYKFKDESVVYKSNQPGIIDAVHCDKRSSDVHKFVKIRVRSLRVPEIGDKFASKNGQKGTVGMIYDEVDMPYTANGVRPDIIMSPWAYPKRMTMNQFIEMLLGKLAVVKGTQIDATPFNGMDVNDMGDILEDNGFSRTGKEILYCGKTGRMMKSEVFIGPSYYMRLKHMSADKIHARSTGPKQLLTQQPTEGKSREGGLRMGEMERDSLLGHGVSAFLKERGYESSDKYVCFVCNSCNIVSAVVNPEQNIYRCTYCKEKSKGFTKVLIPYAAKLFLQEQMAIGILPRLKV